MQSVMPPELAQRIVNAGYYPNIVSDTLDVALAGEDVTAHLVHAETTFDTETVRRHLSVIVLTPSRLVFVHADDHGGDEHGADSHAIASSEAIPLTAVRSVMMTHVVADPAKYHAGDLGREITLTIAWGAVSRIDLEPATCGDPQCTADHGYAGAITGDDLSLRVSAEADGADALAHAISFGKALSAATSRVRQ